MRDHDLLVRMGSGLQPLFDAVTAAFLQNTRDEFVRTFKAGGLLDYSELGETVPWLWRLTFATRGLVRNAQGELSETNCQVVALRFLPDYLRRADKFEMLALVAPVGLFHPNVSAPGICLEIYPGQPLIEICENLHRLFSWRLRQLSEQNAFQKEACVWGRANLHLLPLDSRPLFGKRLELIVESEEERS